MLTLLFLDDHMEIIRKWHNNNRKDLSNLWSTVNRIAGFSYPVYISFLWKLIRGDYYYSIFSVGTVKFDNLYS